MLSRSINDQNQCALQRHYFLSGHSRERDKEMAQNPALSSERILSRRGGKRQGAGRKKQADRGNDVRVRISEAQHLRWNEVKSLKKLPSDNAVAKYLLDLAAEFDEQLNAPWCDYYL